MKRLHHIIIYIILIVFSGRIEAQTKTTCKCIISDYKNFYSLNNLAMLTLGLGVSGVLAHTSADQHFQDWYIHSIKNNITDDISKVVKPFGNGRITVPIYLTAILIGELSKDTKIGSIIGEWGQRCSRTILVGAPPVLFLQVALGASRPDEGRGSRWRPFKDNNGVSGHSFMGAVPFLTAVKMTTKPFLKYSLYLGSTLTGISRINDNKHYLSQVIFGWWIAYLAENSIDRKKPSRFVLTPLYSYYSKGIGVKFYF